MNCVVRLDHRIIGDSKYVGVIMLSPEKAGELIGENMPTFETRIFASFELAREFPFPDKQAAHLVVRGFLRGTKNLVPVVLSAATGRELK